MTLGQPSQLGISPDVYSERDFATVRSMVHGEAGIVLPEQKAMMVYSRLAPLLRRSRCTTFAQYLQLIERDTEERYRVLCALTTNHTHFFREAHHFEMLCQELAESWGDRLRNGGRVRLWSAACSSGEEVWSLVLSLLGKDRLLAKQLADTDFRILATDIDRNVVEVASAATYPEAVLESVPSEIADLWFRQNEGRVTITEPARKLVSFRLLNLMAEWPFGGCFDAILCRNVMIYFDRPTKDRLIERLVDSLAPGGILCIGHSERLTGPAAPALQPIGPTMYRKEYA